MKTPAVNNYIAVMLLMSCFLALPMNAEAYCPTLSWDRLPAYAPVDKSSDGFIAAACGIYIDALQKVASNNQRRDIEHASVLLDLEKQTDQLDWK